jgi:hypothetical protein
MTVFQESSTKVVHNQHILKTNLFTLSNVTQNIYYSIRLAVQLFAEGRNEARSFR